jgi:AraC family ethanolamine operon transcriptional activator
LITHLETTDLDELRAIQQGWDMNYHPLKATRFNSKFLEGSIGGIRVGTEHWSTSVEITGCSIDDALSLVIPIQQGDSYNSRGQEITTEQLDIFAGGCDLHAITQSHTTLLACSISHELLSSEEAFPFTPLQADYRRGHVILNPNPDALLDLRNWCLQLMGIMGRDTLPAESHHYLTEETLCRVARVLCATDQSHAMHTSQYYALARRARDYMLDRQATPPSITEICLAIGTSERTLHTAFRSQYGISPKSFLKTQRLFAAHKRLKKAKAGDQVTDIAMRLGFFETGRFAGEYKAIFGELPSVTLDKHSSN